MGGHQLQDTSQSADPDFGRRDPPHGQSKSQTHFPGTREGQDYGQHGQQGQLERRQGGQTTGDNVYDGGDRDPRQDEYRTRQAVGGSQERFETSENYGTSTGTGPGARSGDNSIHGDGGFGGKPTMPERVIGTLVLFPLLVRHVDLTIGFCLQVLPRRWSERLPVTLGCMSMARSARYANPRVQARLLTRPHLDWRVLNVYG